MGARKQMLSALDAKHLPEEETPEFVDPSPAEGARAARSSPSVRSSSSSSGLRINCSARYELCSKRSMTRLASTGSLSSHPSQSGCGRISSRKCSKCRSPRCRSCRESNSGEIRRFLVQELDQVAGCHRLLSKGRRLLRRASPRRFALRRGAVIHRLLGMDDPLVNLLHLLEVPVHFAQQRFRGSHAACLAPGHLARQGLESPRAGTAECGSAGRRRTGDGAPGCAGTGTPRRAWDTRRRKAEPCPGGGTGRAWSRRAGPRDRGRRAAAAGIAPGTRCRGFPRAPA